MENIKEKSFGVIPIFRDINNNLHFCLIKHSKGHWGFPKGHQDISESEKETAIRELNEETGIVINDLKDDSFVEEYSFKYGDINHDKSVKYFIGFVSSTTSTTPKNFKKEIPELKWVTYEEAKKLITFSEARKMLDGIMEYLK